MSRSPDMYFMWGCAFANLASLIACTVYLFEIAGRPSDTVIHNIATAEIAIQFSGMVCLAFTVFYFSMIAKSIQQTIKKTGGYNKVTCRDKPQLFGENSPSCEVYIGNTLCITIMAVGTLANWVGLGMWIPIRHLDGWNSDDNTKAHNALICIITSRVMDTLCLVLGHAWAVVNRRCIEKISESEQ